MSDERRVTSDAASEARPESGIQARSSIYDLQLGAGVGIDFAVQANFFKSRRGPLHDFPQFRPNPAGSFSKNNRIRGRKQAPERSCSQSDVSFTRKVVTRIGALAS